MKSKILLTTFLSMLLPYILIGQRLLDLTNYKMVWNDEFNYTSVNDIFSGPNPKWRYDPGWGPCFPETNGYYSTENMSLVNGCIVLESKPKSSINCTSASQTTSQLWSTYDSDYPDNNTHTKGFNYGIFEIRAKLPDKDGDYSAFWFWNDYWQAGNIDSGLNCAKPAHPGWEIDVFEATKFNNDFNFFSTIQPNGNSIPKCTGCSTWYDFSNPKAADKDTFHVYTLAWTPTAITWFIDGVEIRTQTTGLVPYKLQMILSLFNYNGNVSDKFEIDYVRLYRPLNTPSIGPNGSLWTHYEDLARIAWTNEWPNYMTTEGWFNYNIRSNSISPNSTCLLNSSTYGPTLFYTVGTNLYSANIANNGITSFSGILASNVGGNMTPDETTVKFYYKSTDNDIYIYYYFNGNWLIGLVDWEGLYPNDVASDVLFVKENEFHPSRIYYRNTSNVLCYYEYCATNSKFYHHKTTINFIKGSLAAAKIPAGKLFFQGTDNHIYNVWQYWNSSSPCNNNLVPTWAYDAIDSPYLASNGDCAGDIVVSPDGKKIYFRDTNSQLSYYTLGTSGYVNTKTGINNVLGKIRINEDDSLYYVSTDHKIWNYYKRKNVPLINGSEQWLAAPLVHTNSNPVLTHLEVTTTKPTQVLHFKQQNDPTQKFHLNYFKWVPNMGVVNPPCDNDRASENKNYFKQNAEPISEKHEIKNIIYPNPNSGKFQLINPFSSDAEYKILDNHGRILTEGNIGDQEASINLPHLVSGLYIVEISSKTGQIRTKLNVH